MYVNVGFPRLVRPTPHHFEVPISVARGHVRVGYCRLLQPGPRGLDFFQDTSQSRTLHLAQCTASLRAGPAPIFRHQRNELRPRATTQRP